MSLANISPSHRRGVFILDIMNATKKKYWQLHDLVVIGIFAAVTKATSILITLAGGGMNPLSLLLKNLVYTTMVIVLLYKVRKFGCLFLFLLVGTIVSLMLMGGQAFLLVPTLFGALIAEAIILLLGGYQKSVNLMIGVGIYDLISKTASLAIVWLFMREHQEMVILVAGIVAIGYVGAFIGLFTGAYFVKELRHSGIIRN